MRQYKSSLLSCWRCKNKWIPWMILEIFKMWNQNIVEGCLTFPVPLWWFRVLVPCSAVPLDTWNTSGLQENGFFSKKQFSTFDSPRDFPQRIQSDDVQRDREAVLEAGRTKTVHTSEDRLHQGTNPMPTYATKPWTTSSTMPVEFQQNYMVGQQRQQISEFPIRQIPQSTSFQCGKFGSKLKWLPVLIFHRMLCYGSKKWRWLILWMN